MLAQESDDGVDTMVLGSTDHAAPDLFLCDQAGVDQTSKMKRQSRCGQVEASLYLADAEAAGAGANQQPVNVQTGQVAEFGKAAGGQFPVHMRTILQEPENTTIKLVLWLYN